MKFYLKRSVTNIHAGPSLADMVAHHFQVSCAVHLSAVTPLASAALDASAATTLLDVSFAGPDGAKARCNFLALSNETAINNTLS